MLVVCSRVGPLMNYIAPSAAPTHQPHPWFIPVGPQTIPEIVCRGELSERRVVGGGMKLALAIACPWWVNFVFHTFRV